MLPFIQGPQVVFYKPEIHGDIEALLVRVNKRPHVIRKSEPLTLQWGDTFRIVGSLSAADALHTGLIHNFVGYYGGVNGLIEDDTGLNIPLKRTTLLKRFSEDETGSLYKVTSQDNSHKFAKFYVKLQ